LVLQKFDGVVNIAAGRGVGNFPNGSCGMSHSPESDGHRIWCRKSFDGNCKVKKGVSCQLKFGRYLLQQLVAHGRPMQRNFYHLSPALKVIQNQTADWLLITQWHCVASLPGPVQSSSISSFQLELRIVFRRKFAGARPSLEDCFGPDFPLYRLPHPRTISSFLLLFTSPSALHTASPRPTSRRSALSFPLFFFHPFLNIKLTFPRSP
jgi:hypothetical protein